MHCFHPSTASALHLLEHNAFASNVPPNYTNLRLRPHRVSFFSLCTILPLLGTQFALTNFIGQKRSLHYP